MSVKKNHLIGTVYIIIGCLIILFVLGDILFRLIIALIALTLINYGLRLRGLPPLQILIPLMIAKNRFF
jgi:predicted membrane protein